MKLRNLFTMGASTIAGWTSRCWTATVCVLTGAVLDEDNSREVIAGLIGRLPGITST